MKNFLAVFSLAVMACAFSSCAITSPKEKLIVGTWTPVKVEKYISPEDMEKMKSQQAQSGSSTSSTSATTSGAGKSAKMDTASRSKLAARGAGHGGAEGGTPDQRAEAQMTKLIQTEMRTQLMIGADKIAAKNYPGKPIKGSWKMNSKGTKVVAKSFQTKEKYVFDILELTETNLQVIENLPVGALKISYVKEK